MSVSPAAEITGSGHLPFSITSGGDIINGGLLQNIQLNIGGTGVDQTTLDPILTNVGLQVAEDAEVLIRSQSFDIDGGIQVGLDSTVEIVNTFGGSDRLLSSNLSGIGLVDLKADMQVYPSLLFSLGTGSLQNGSGGFLLDNATLELFGTLTNLGRFRFLSGTLTGGGPFINANDGWAYVTSGGPGASSVSILNYGNFEVQGQFTQNTAQFVNDRTLTLRPVTGGVIFDGTGSVLNRGDFSLEGDVYTNSRVTTTFTNESTVRVVNGILRFEGTVTNVTPEGDLDGGGDWNAEDNGVIIYPGGVLFKEVKGGTRVGLSGTGDIPALAALEGVSEESTLALDTGAGLSVAPSTGIFYLDVASDLLVFYDSVFQLFATMLINNSSLVAVGPSGQVNVQNDINLGDESTVDSIIPELQGIVILARHPGPGRPAGVPEVPEGTLPPTVTTPLLNNHGRVLPSERGAVGTLQLTGDYFQHDNGHLFINVADSGADLLAIDGDATLGGTLELRRVIGFDPVIGQPYTILSTTGSRNGTFDEVDTLDTVRVIYNPQGVEVIYNVLGPMEVFSSGFETGDTAEWSTVVP